ncbi:MAG: hypothetical protein HY695_17255 [Deltaproteobacteria bacterium]|nr:hypothetical protein [Deltaproteobacteria bacterium]
MQSSGSNHGAPDPEIHAFYREALTTLRDSRMEFLVGGAYSMLQYAGIARNTKDLDIFIRPEDCDRILELLSGTGCRTQVMFPHWLGKAYCGSNYIDVIFSSGNAVAQVDDEWFAHAVEGDVLGIPVRFCPPEETIWSKAFVMERERYDGADIAHLIRACGKTLDWRRLLRRFGSHWRVLLSHLVLFEFAYPSEQSQVPEWVMRELTRRLHNDRENSGEADRICQGTLLSREQYLVDIDQWGYRDARLLPKGNMTKGETERWTAAIPGKSTENPGEK